MFQHLLAMSVIGMTMLNPFAQPDTPQVLSQHEFPLGDRYNTAGINNVFDENILLTLHDMAKQPSTHTNIDQPFSYSFTLNPNQTFAFHDSTLPQYTNVVQTTNTHFTADEGFVSDGYLVGDGVCHLAALMNWVAQDAGLEVNAPTNHNFAVIPDVPKEYGVAIYTSPKDTVTSEKQNLYITNNKDKPVTFAFNYDGQTVSVKVTEEN